MAVLIVYCMKDIPSGGISAAVPKLLAATVVFITYKWKHQTLIFILLGTISYMMIRDCVFLFLLCSNQHILPRKCKPIMPDPFLRHAKGHQFCVVFFIHDLF